MRPRLPWVALSGLLSSLLVSVPLAAVDAETQGENAGTPINLTLTPSAPEVPEGDIRRDATVRAIEIAMPSVVNIATATIKQYADFDPIFQQFYGPVHQREELYSIGSGIIIDEDGYVLTNLHVLQRATRAQVKLWNGMVYDVESTLVASPNSDLALIKLQKKYPNEKFQPIKFAGDDDLLLGETVIAIGNPFGLGGSVSRGILSSKNRRPAVADAKLDVPDMLQTDAAINPGNSGGPLINLHGDLIGVNSDMGNGRGIGLAIPIKQVQTALSELLTPELTDKLWLVAHVRTRNGDLMINFEQPGSPADHAGLRVGQQVLQVNSKTPDDLGELNRLIVAGGGRNVTLGTRQGSQTATAVVNLVPFGDVVRGKIGVTLGPLPPETTDNYGIDSNKGTVITNVEKGSPAENAKLRAGMIVVGIDGHDSGNLFTVGNILSAKISGETAQIVVVAPRRAGTNELELRQGTVSVRVR